MNEEKSAEKSSQKFFGKLKKYINSINLIIYIAGLIISVLFIGIYFIDPTNYWLTISMSIGASLIGAVILAVALEISNNTRKIKMDQEQERDKIKKYSKNLEFYISKYIYYFNAISLSLKDREEISDRSMITPNFENFTDIYQTSLLITDLKTSVLERFYEYENQLCNTFDIIHREVEFVYYKQFEEHIAEFVKISHEYNVKPFLLKLPNQRLANGETLSELAIKIISEDKNNIIVEFEKGKYKGNVVTAFVIFYKMLLKQKDILNKIKADFQIIAKEN